MVTEYKNISALSGKPTEEVHHLIFGNGLRRLADADDLTIPLTAQEHRHIHADTDLASMSRIIGQLQWELQNAATEERRVELREQFRKRYGKSYL